MKKTANFLFFSVAFLVWSCNMSNTDQMNAENASSSSSSLQLSDSEKDSIIRYIDAWRSDIEFNLNERVELSTNGLREKIKQKWSKIHYYIQNGQVVRIKTYPHESISSRTEEFYLKDGKLLLAVIRDNGIENKENPLENVDKMYYFFNDQLVKELKQNNEPEFTIRYSDAEELLSEAAEYLTIFNNQ